MIAKNCCNCMHTWGYSDKTICTFGDHRKPFCAVHDFDEEYNCIGMHEESPLYRTENQYCDMFIGCNDYSRVEAAEKVEPYISRDWVEQICQNPEHYTDQIVYVLSYLAKQLPKDEERENMA